MHRCLIGSVEKGNDLMTCSQNMEAPLNLAERVVPVSPLVSIVIPTNREEKNIGNCLKSLTLQSYKNIEVIVVDNESKDKTREIAGEFTDKVYVKTGESGPPRRNFGAKKASGKYLMAIDADMILTPDLIELCVDYMERTDCLALYVPEIVLGKKFWSQVRRFERSFYDGTVIDAARFYKKDIYDGLGGWDEQLVGVDDWDFDKKLRNRGAIDLLRVPSPTDGAQREKWAFDQFIIDRGVDPGQFRGAVFHNESEFDMKKYFRKKNYYLNTLDVYFNRWGRSDPDLKKQFGLYYRYVGVFIEKGKWRKLIRHPALAVGMYFLRFMIGAVYLTSEVKGLFSRREATE